MKKILLTIGFLVSIQHYCSIYAQINNQYFKVVYKLKVDEGNSEPKKYKNFIEKLRKARAELEFELISNYQIGIYKLNKKLELKEDEIVYQLAINQGGGNSIYYRTLDKKIEHVQDFGKKINIIYDLNELHWEITKETKKVKGFTCYKAIGYKEQYDPGRKKMLTFSPIAWFAPEINVPFGPKGIDGLPGLVLEGSMNRKLFFYADKIQIGTEPKNEKKLRMENGEEMSEKEYLELLQKMRPIPN